MPQVYSFPLQSIAKIERRANSDYRIAVDDIPTAGDSTLITGIPLDMLVILSGWLTSKLDPGVVPTVVIELEAVPEKRESDTFFTGEFAHRFEIQA